MKYSPEFLETNARLKTLDEETLNDELNKMTADELLAHGDYMIQQTLEEKDLLSEEEAQAHINELLQLTREPTENERKPFKVHTHRTAKRILILAAAILVLISVFMVAAVASKRDFSILNGFVRFEDGKVQVHFGKSTAFDSMSLTELEADLIKHGFDDVKLPRFFFDGDWAVTNKCYYQDEDALQVNFEINKKEETFYIEMVLDKDITSSNEVDFLGVESGETIQHGEISTYLFDHGKSRCELIYFTDNIEYSVFSVSSVEKMRTIAETVV